MIATILISNVNFHTTQKNHQNRFFPPYKFYLKTFWEDLDGEAKKLDIECTQDNVENLINENYKFLVLILYKKIIKIELVSKKL